MAESTMIGADPDLVDELARELTSAAAQLQQVQTRLTGAVRTAPWAGLHADRFRADWDARHGRALVAAAGELERTASRASLNATDQRQASAARADGGAVFSAMGLAHQALLGGMQAVTGAPLPGQPTLADLTFQRIFGRLPVTDIDRRTAAALDGTSHLQKNGGVPAVVQVGRITPRPGQGLVRIALYIPSAEVFNVPNYDQGDNRGPDPGFDPEASRVTLYLDYESGIVVARQNPSVDSSGTVIVGTPDVRVSETTNGAVRIQYDAANPFAPPDPTNSHTVNGDVVISPPAGTSSGWRLDGTIGDYPSFEAYHDDPSGHTQTLLSDPADNDGAYGPLLGLPFHHDVGDGANSDALHQFGVPLSGPYYQLGDGVPLGGLNDPPQIRERTPYGLPVGGGVV